MYFKLLNLYLVLQGAANVAAVNMTKNKKLVKSYNISEPATIILFKNDKYSPEVYKGIKKFIRQYS